MSFTNLQALFTHYNAEFKATADEIQTWKTLNKDQIYSEPDSVEVVTSVGLFGADLNSFHDDCVSLEDLCNLSDYADYTGWGVGVNFASDSPVTATQIDGVALTTSKWTLQNTWSSSTNVVESGVADFNISDWFSYIEGPTVETAEDPFEGWAAAPGDNAAPQFAFALFKNESDFYFEAGDVTSAWATFGGVDGIYLMVESSEFEFVGAAALAATTSLFVFVALLL
jgi:hypothetical protein